MAHKENWKSGERVTSEVINAWAAALNTLELAALPSRARQLAGTSATASATAAKQVNLVAPYASVQPVLGDYLALTLGPGMSVSNPTLAVNGGTAYPIRTTQGQTSSSYIAVEANGTILLRFDGTYWRTVGSPVGPPAAVTAAEIQAGSSTSIRVLTPQILAANLLNLAAAKPASATATGRAGQYFVDATGLYVCIATNTWRLFAGVTF